MVASGCRVVLYTYLVIADIVVALVHALPVRPMRDRFCHVLDIRDFVDEGPNWPAGVTPTNSVQINFVES